MLDWIGSARDSIIVGAVFALVLAVWLAVGFGILLRQEIRKRRLRSRLGILDAESTDKQTRVLRLWREGDDATTTVPHTSWLARSLESIQHLPRDAGMQVSFGTIVGIMFGAAIMLGILCWAFTQSMIAAVAVSLSTPIWFHLYIQREIAGQTSKFDRQFEDSLQLIARSLRAGQPLLGAFQLVSEEMDQPISGIFNEICQQQALGLSLEEAIRRVTDDSSSEDMKLFGTSVVIQPRSGGNLADMMNRLAHVVRDRMRLMRRVKMLTAQTQYSKRVLLVLPFVVILVLNIVEPEYMKPMIETPPGRMMLIVAACNMIMGTWIMNRMADLKY